MINTFRSRKTIEALKWDGENLTELEEFVGKENVEWKFYTNHKPVPCIKDSNTDIIEVDVLPYYITYEDIPMYGAKFTVYTKQEFEREYEKI